MKSQHDAVDGKAGKSDFMANNIFQSGKTFFTETAKEGFQLGRTLFTSLILISLFNVVFAACTSTGQLDCAMYQVCNLVNGLLPVIAFVLFVLAGVAYAAGNFFGAETRAKAIGYSMNMITGAIIALILGIIGPTIIGALVPTGGPITSTSTCTNIKTASTSAGCTCT